MQQRTIIRNVLKGIGIIGIVLFFIEGSGGYYFLMGSFVALFLGVTDFGNQCPLFLSAKQLFYRFRTKKQRRIL